MILNANFHTHTVMCDGRDTAEDMVKQALSLGFTQLGFSGHMDPDIHMDWNAYTREINRLKEAYRDRIEILRGVELDTLYDPASCPGAEYIIGSTHFMDVDYERPLSVDCCEEDMALLADEFFGGDYYRLAKAYYEVEAKVFERTNCTFVGHFDLVTRFNDSMHFLDEEDPRYKKAALETMELLVKQGLPFEINCGAYNRGRKKEFYPNMLLLKNLHDMGGRILINSDAHSRELLNGGFDEALKAAAFAGFDHILVLKGNGQGGTCFRELPIV